MDSFNQKYPAIAFELGKSITSVCSEINKLITTNLKLYFHFPLIL